MSTSIRSTISKRNKYWIPKHRYLELRHFCLQYPEWKRDLREYSWRSSGVISQGNEWSDPTSKAAERREQANNCISMVEKCAKASSNELWAYLLKAVTQDMSYVALRMIDEIPCGRDMYYECYRKFFWLLDKSR